MKSFLLFCISLTLIIAAGPKLAAQHYSLAVDPVSFTLDQRSFEGYSTKFTQPYKEVKKEWWRYVNAHTIIFNHKTYLELTIPAQKKDANTPLKFVSQLTQSKNKKESVLQMALITDDIPEDQLKEQKIKARYLMKDFKISYFTGLIQEKIKEEENSSKKISMAMDEFLLHNSKLQYWIDKKPEDKDKFVKKLEANTKEVEKLQAQLNASQLELEKLKKRLVEIK